jgi:hypothetical protein
MKTAVIRVENASQQVAMLLDVLTLDGVIGPE